tara:strand:+ start:10253 stop:10531 length:279 start_codon:yes stop_codon:yes gene_type:complete
MSDYSVIQGEVTIEHTDLPEMNGYQLIYKFDNGYGASVVKHDFSYGGKKGLYEVAVLDNEGDLCYTTPITDNVIGHLTMDEANVYLAEISKL